MEEQEKEDYKRRLEEFRHQEGVTEDDLKLFERQEILKKSLDQVKKRAEDLDHIRHDSARYKQVKSKVTQCLKV